MNLVMQYRDPGVKLRVSVPVDTDSYNASQYVRDHAKRQLMFEMSQSLVQYANTNGRLSMMIDGGFLFGEDD